MIKVYCDRCGKEKTNYADLGYYITISHMQRKELCKKCMREAEQRIRGFMEEKE